MGVTFKGDRDTALWLIETAGCDVNHQNLAGQSALMLAALFDREAILQLLLKQGANPELRDRQGNTAISLANAQGLNKVALMIDHLSTLR